MWCSSTAVWARRGLRCGAAALRVTIPRPPSAPPGRITPASNEAGRPRPTTAKAADRALGRSIEHVDRGRRVAGGVGPLRPHDPIVRQRVSAGRLVDIQHDATV
jgi:hypothetical protein